MNWYYTVSGNQLNALRIYSASLNVNVDHVLLLDRREKKNRLIAEKKSKEEELARDLAAKTSPGSKRRRPRSAPARR